ncbi:cation efflux family protein family [Patellaria atrata CBS 101060]|uniref:Zinc transporter n=1 Tax=Patellaria atrata CBS 101060 TaxID=1346257 RepID=A0A9P4SJ15_9PEZI|nr:cation efflux family protein family [Patellaria atrata CBS 101060]
MASSMPLPVPPQTPTPPPEDIEQNPHGLGIHDTVAEMGFNPDALSPTSATFPSHRYATLGAPTSSSHGPNSPLSPASISYSSMSGGNATETPLTNDLENSKSPFKFQTVEYTIGKPPPKQDIGRRRGHKYKHSSVSHQIFLEPVRKEPLQVPSALPKPTHKEMRASMSVEQKYRAAWSLCHLAIAAFVQWSGHESLLMTALSHMLFYDAVGAMLCVYVDVYNNFPVWKSTSLQYPFGLERMEVLAGLGMAVALLFMGLDLISHGLTHALENTGGHEAHHAHGHERVSAGEIDIAALSAIGSTLVSAIILKNHSRIGKVMQLSYFSSLPAVLSNPSHLLTLSCSTLLLLLPLFEVKIYLWLDRSIGAVIASAMIGLGWNLGWTLGKMLMQSYSGPGLEAVLRDIENDPSVTTIEEAKVWQVHYGLCQANFKLRVRSLDDMTRLRDRISSLVRNRLGGGYGTGGQKWEISTQLSLEKD